MQGRLSDATSTGTKVLRHYRFDAVDVRLIVPFGVQTGVSLGFDSTGTVIEETYDAAGTLRSSTTAPFAQTFAVRQATGARWLTVAMLPPGAGT